MSSHDIDMSIFYDFLAIVTPAISHVGWRKFFQNKVFLDVNGFVKANGFFQFSLRR